MSANRVSWLSRGDFNAFFGLILDNIAVLLVLLTTITTALPFSEQMAKGQFGFTQEFVLGHMIPGTALGVLLGLNVWIGLGAAATWAMIAFFLRISSLSALVAAVSAPVFCLMLYGLHPFTLACCVIALLLIWRHKTNIKNLLAGTEPRIGAKRA